MGRIVEKLLFARVLERWRRLAQQAHKAPLSRLRDQRNRARKLRFHLDRLIHIAEGRLALPQIGSNAFPRPHGTDWGWRPELWRGPLPVPGASSVSSKTRLGDEVQLFHDCTVSELTLRQLRNNRDEDLAPYGVRLDVFRFDGSFLSLVIELPAEVTDGLSRDHLLRVDCTLETENPIEIFARLNIKHGPNTEQLVREMPMGSKRTHVEYDLAYAELNEKRVERLWLELIFEAPEMNQVTLRDVTLSRSRRASL
ncbi:DUF6478 family protein [Phaeobacter porticola]|uniref:Uncharacterized protein n=1 Tax=Phaeobacter porticola TaxID=1844006 RepID=A0A1L3I0C6_9RHOB|nr:DUF6478 family protein [Phaeobacter porticola]APG45565.1 hypothetical protein PhaeoP97_00110 [Phaeobacter porticola]